MHKYIHKAVSASMYVVFVLEILTARLTSERGGHAAP